VRPILVPVSPWSRRMCVEHVQRDIYCKSLALNPQRLAPPLLPHLTGQRAVTALAFAV
jgi:hypothetical protein